MTSANKKQYSARGMVIVVVRVVSGVCRVSVAQGRAEYTDSACTSLFRQSPHLFVAQP